MVSVEVPGWNSAASVYRPTSFATSKVPTRRPPWRARPLGYPLPVELHVSVGLVEIVVRTGVDGVARLRPATADRSRRLPHEHLGACGPRHEGPPGAGTGEAHRGARQMPRPALMRWASPG